MRPVGKFAPPRHPPRQPHACTPLHLRPFPRPSAGTRRRSSRPAWPATSVRRWSWRRNRRCGPGHSARWRWTTRSSSPPACGHARPGWAATGAGCRLHRPHAAKCRSRSTTARTRTSRPPCSTCSTPTRPAPRSSASLRMRKPTLSSAAKSCAAATACRTTASTIRTAFPCSARAPSRVRSGKRRTRWPGSPAKRHASSAPRPACATCSSHRCCSASICSS